MLKYLFTLLVMSSASAQSLTWKVVRSAEDKLYIESKDCNTAKRYTAILKQWKAKLGEPTVNELQVSNQKGLGCRIDITKHVPIFVGKHHSAHQIEDWGNCFGAALAAAGMVDDFIDTHTMLYGSNNWLRPPLCKIVPPGEALAPGDIANIKESARENDVHAFIYLGDGMVFSKNSASKTTSFELQSLDAVLKLYPVDLKKECRHHSGVGPVKNCARTLSYYRCSTMKQLIQVNQKHVPKEYYNLESIIKAAEERVRERSLNSCPKSFDHIRAESKAILDPLMSLSQSEIERLKGGLKKKGLTAQQKKILELQEFLWDTLNFRISALGEWIEG